MCTDIRRANGDEQKSSANEMSDVICESTLGLREHEVRSNPVPLRIVEFVNVDESDLMCYYIFDM